MRPIAVLCLSVGTLFVWPCPVLADRTDNPRENRSGVSGLPTESKDAPPQPAGEAPPEQGAKPDPKPAGSAGVGASDKAADKPKDDKASAEPSGAASKDKPADGKAPDAKTVEPNASSAEPAKDALAGAEGKGTMDKPEKPPRGSAGAAPLTRKDIVLELQAELKRVGCYDGAIDGAWGAGSSGALEEFGARGRVKSRDLSPSEDWLTRVKAARKRVCTPDRPVRYRPRVYRGDDFNDFYDDGYWGDY